MGQCVAYPTSFVSPPLQGVAKFVTSLIGASVELVRALPYGDFILVGTAVGLPIYLWYDKEFGGYSGKMGATKCLQLMSKGRAVLIDTRDERVRARCGAHGYVTDLRRLPSLSGFSSTCGAFITHAPPWIAGRASPS